MNFIQLILTFVIVTFAAGLALAASNNPLNSLTPLLYMLGGEYGGLLQAVATIGSFRVFNKPVTTLIRLIVSKTTTKKDDTKWAKIQKHWLFKALSFLLDWGASVKLHEVKRK